MSDLEAAWKDCGGCCAVSGMPFDFEVVGDGQARHPFEPSLDRIDRHKSYRRDNVRLVTSIANFAMNAWGDEPLHQLATALHQKYGNRTPLAMRGPSDSDPDNNSSERALRHTATYRKVTGCFRSVWGANLFAAIRSVIGTAARHSIDAYEAIRMTLHGQSALAPV